MQAAIRAVEYFLPPDTLDNDDLASQYPGWTVEKIENKTGIRRRHVVAPDQCASDLGVEAAERLLEQSDIRRDQIDCLIFCTQSPDYLLPTSACLIQNRLGLPTGISAFDFNLGCSGYVYGLGIAKGLVETGQAQNVLLITADTYSRLIHPEDKSVRTLFGDAGAATLISTTLPADSEPPAIGPFVYGTDGRGAKNLIVPAGGLRTPCTPQTKQRMEDHSGNARTQENLYMNGAQIFTFTLREVPKLVKQALAKAELAIDQIDQFIFHQANQFMLESLQEKCALPADKFFIGMHDIGNTVSSTLPIALHQAAEAGRISKGHRIMLVGFGVGYSWGATFIRW